MMGMEQERNGGGGLWRRPGLRRLRVEGLGSLYSGGSLRPGCTSMRPLHGNGDVASMETGVCICRKASRLGSSHCRSPCIWQLKTRWKTGNKKKTETEKEKKNKGYSSGGIISNFLFKKSLFL